MSAHYIKSSELAGLSSALFVEGKQYKGILDLFIAGILKIWSRSANSVS